MNNKVGIIGNSGRMGVLLAEKISISKDLKLGSGYSRNQTPFIKLEDVFASNDYIVDFSKAELVEEVLKKASEFLKPTIICTTGWDLENLKTLIEDVAKKTIIVIASNTSVGACLQRYLVREATRILSDEFEIDIHEKHHKHKVDIPSGTAKSLFEQIIKIRHNSTLQILEQGPRPNNIVCFSAQRTGNIVGEHKVEFNSSHEMVSIEHIAFDRSIFAFGAIRILNWIKSNKPSNGLYTMENVLNLR